MKPRFSIPLFLLLLGFVVTIIQMAYFYPRLPERLATHFGPSGYPDGWASKGGFVASFGVFLLFDTLLFVGLALLLPRMPTDALNMPNKDYWLSPENRAASLAYLSDQMLWFGAGTFALLVSLMQMTFNVNLTPTPSLGIEAWLMLGGYLVFVTVWLIALFRRFARPA
jgi:uncharacterized membrane protein